MREIHWGCWCSKEASPDQPLITTAGKVLTAIAKRRGSVLPLSSRFPQYAIEEKKTGNSIGPECYDIRTAFNKRVINTPVYKGNITQYVTQEYSGSPLATRVVRISREFNPISHKKLKLLAQCRKLLSWYRVTPREPNPLIT